VLSVLSASIVAGFSFSRCVEEGADHLGDGPVGKARTAVAGTWMVKVRADAGFLQGFEEEGAGVLGG